MHNLVTTSMQDLDPLKRIEAVLVQENLSVGTGRGATQFEAKELFLTSRAQFARGI